MSEQLSDRSLIILANYLVDESGVETEHLHLAEVELVAKEIAVGVNLASQWRPDLFACSTGKIRLGLLVS